MYERVFVCERVCAGAGAGVLRGVHLVCVCLYAYTYLHSSLLVGKFQQN